MDRYELGEQDINDVLEALLIAASGYREDGDATTAERFMDLRERFQMGHVAYIETEQR